MDDPLAEVLEEYRHATHEDLLKKARLKKRIKQLAPFPDEFWCARCERIHAYCECDEYAHLGIHSVHHLNNPSQIRPHPMGE